MNKIIKIILLIIALVLLLTGCSNGEFEAVEKGDLATVKTLLAANPSLLNSTDRNGFSMLHYAAQNGHLNIINLLLASGAQIDGYSHDGNAFTPLYLAAAQNQKKVVVLLLEKGANIEARCKGSRQENWTPLEIAAWNNHIEIVDLLIKNGAKLNQTAVCNATYKGYLDIVSLMIERGAKLDEQGGHAWGPLHIAVSRGHQEIVQLLLKHGADVNRKSYSDKTPLHSIIHWKRDHKEITRILLSHGAKVNALNSFRETPLHIAAQYNFFETAVILLENGAQTDLVDHLNNTALSSAYWHGHKDIVRKLLSLHTAAKNGQFTTVQTLLNKMPQLINSKDMNSKTPLYFAAENNHPDIARLLIEQGADANIASKYMSTELLHGIIAEIVVPKVGRIKMIKSEKTPLDIAVQKGFNSMAKLLDDYTKKQ